MASCDVDVDLEKLLTAELTVAMSGGSSRRKRMRGGMQVIAAVKALKAALCSTVRMTVSDAVNYPAGLMQPITDFLMKIQEDSDEGKAAKAAFYSKIKSLLKASVGTVAMTDLASPSSKIVRIAVVILKALNEALPNPLQVGLQALPDLTENLTLMATSAAPVINTALITAASFWALRAVKRRVIDPFVNTIFETVSKVPEDLSDKKTDEAIDAVMAQVPQLAHMALNAGRGAVRAAGTVWAGRLRSSNQANPEGAVVAAAAIGAGAARDAAAAAMSAEGPAANDGDVDDIAAEAAPAASEGEAVAGGRRRRTRKLRKMRNVRRKRTLRRKH